MIGRILIGLKNIVVYSVKNWILERKIKKLQGGKK